jgi:hypothetical protein
VSGRAAKKLECEPGLTALAFPSGHPQAEEVAEALVRAQAARGLEDLYDAWLRLRLARAASAAERSRESERLEVRAEYLLKSVESARQLEPAARPAAKKAAKKPKGRSSKALQPAADPFASFLESAQRELAAAREELAARASREEALFEEQIKAIRARIGEQVEATLAIHKPQVDAMVQPVGTDRAIFHTARPEGEDSLLLGYVLSGKLFTRYGAFFDDSVDDLSLPPALFYEDEGGKARPGTVDEEDALALDPERELAPVKGMIAFRIPGHDFPRFRLLNRGPLAQIETRLEGGAYEQLLPREVAELLSGYLIRLEVEGRIALSMRVA